MFSLKNDLLKAITPWVGNVILPPPVKDNTFCEGTDPCFTFDKTPENMWFSYKQARMEFAQKT